jgi:hypothetical protein
MESGMKRKAMLMGMAVMASMPGWAMAKGAGKVAMHVYSDGVEAKESLPAVEVVDELPGVSGADFADASPGKAAELLAQVKSMLARANYGAVAKLADDGTRWTMEIPHNFGEALDYGDARLRPAVPLGVALRLKF